MGTPSSATTATQVNARVVSPLLAATPGSSSLIPTRVANPVVKDFGRDKDLKNLFKNIQSKAFTRQGNNIPKVLKEWIMSMDDYFTLASYNTLAQGIMGRL